MAFESALPLVAGVLALAISGVLLTKYKEKGKMHYLLWGVGMFLWAISDFTQLYALLLSWTALTYLAYFFSSIMLAGFLGAGTIYLIMPNSRISSYYLWFNVIFAIALVVSLLMAPLNASALQNAVAGANGISGIPNYIAAIVNIPALFTFAGGAAYSFIKTRKLYALLITIGALIPAAGGTLAAVALPQLLPFTDFFGILFLGAGFYLSFQKINTEKQNWRRPTLMKRKNAAVAIRAIMSIIVIAALIAICWYVLQQHQTAATAINQTEFNSTGTCSLFNETANLSILTCLSGQSSKANSSGFKLLKVNDYSTQVLVYQTCAACIQFIGDPYQYAQVINVSLFQTFGGVCESTPNSRLLAVNITAQTAVYSLNMSGLQICI